MFGLVRAYLSQERRFFFGFTYISVAMNLPPLVGADIFSEAQTFLICANIYKEAQTFLVNTNIFSEARTLLVCANIYKEVQAFLVGVYIFSVAQNQPPHPPTSNVGKVW
jgi:hypothetical protein